jgi:hypothetical protein
MLTSYSVATFSSIGVALSFRSLIKRRIIASSAGKLYLLNTITSVLACGTAGFMNTFLMRYPEIINGISILDPKTNLEVGNSKLAAKTAVF